MSSANRRKVWCVCAGDEERRCVPMRGRINSGGSGLLGYRLFCALSHRHALRALVRTMGSNIYGLG